MNADVTSAGAGRAEGAEGATPVVWMDGALRAPSEALISVLDRGLTMGAAAFETMKVVRGQPFAIGRHLARLRRSCGRLGLDLDLTDDDLRAGAATAIGAAGQRAGRVRMTVTGGVPDQPPGSVVITVTALDPPPAAALRCVTVPWRRNERGAAVGLKTTSYAENVIALDHARALGADEPIFANTVGELCEGAISNVFLALGGTLVTPSLSSGCLAGVTRELLLEALGDAVVELDLPIEALGRATEAFITSSTRGVAAIASVDGRALPACPGALTVAAQEAWASIEAGPTDP